MRLVDAMRYQLAVQQRFGVPCRVRVDEDEEALDLARGVEDGGWVLSFTAGLQHPRFMEAARWLEVELRC